MHAKFYTISALLGGLIIFVWQAISHMLVPWPGEPMHMFTNEAAVDSAVRSYADTNGVYMTKRGLFMVVAYRPDMADKTADMTRNLVVQFVIDAVVAGLLAWLLLRTGGRGALATASFFAVVAVLAAIQYVVSDWNWYGLSSAYALSTIADVVIGWFLCGLFVGWARRKFLPSLVPS